MKYFLFNHSGSLNRGCEAIVRGTINIISNYDKECSFLLSSFDPEADRIIENIGIEKFEARPLTETEKFISALNVKLKHSEEYALKKMYSSVVRQAEDCDICLSIGGDTYCYGDNHEIRVLTNELKNSGKKVVLWGASIGAEDLSDEKLESLKVFDAIFARESLTYNLLKEKDANSSIFLNADPAFCMDREDVPIPDGFTKENTLGINVSPLIEKKNPGITGAVTAFIEYIIEKTTLNIMLVPHVTEDGNSDYEYMLPFLQKYRDSGRVAMASPGLNAKQYKGIIAKLRFFIGARTHSTIAAYSSGVPTFVLGYSVKSRGIATDIFGDDRYVADVLEISDGSILVNALNTLLSDENEIKETLRKKIPVMLRSSMQMGAELTEL